MKKIVLFLALITLVFTGCKKDEIPDRGQLNPDAMILIRPASQTKSAVVGLSNLEIVEETVNMKWRSHWFDTGGGSEFREDEYVYGRSFSENQRDMLIPALKMWGTDIISQGDYLVKDFIYGYDIFLTDINSDTIGYIPQSIIDNARVLIEAAYNEKDYNEVYRLFDEAFTFLPIPE